MQNSSIITTIPHDAATCRSILSHRESQSDLIMKRSSGRVETMRGKKERRENRADERKSERGKERRKERKEKKEKRPKGKKVGHSVIGGLVS